MVPQKKYSFVTYEFLAPRCGLYFYSVTQDTNFTTTEIFYSLQVYIDDLYMN